MAVKFIKGAHLPQDYPQHDWAEVAFVGRSNSGKSSLINALVQSKIARVGQKPGMTRDLNFFKWNDGVLVDLPGYGFAARSIPELKKWQETVETYLTSRECLKIIVLVVDARREWTEDESQLVNWIDLEPDNVFVALTKTDKLNRKEFEARGKYFKEAVPGFKRFMVSSQNGDGIDHFRKAISMNLGEKP